MTTKNVVDNRLLLTLGVIFSKLDAQGHIVELL